jgi:hypothetical protein
MTIVKQGPKRKQKSLPKLKKQALDLYSELIKLKAFNEGKLRCYTCDTPLTLNSSNTQLGHYLSRGAYPGLTFHPDNSRIQDIRCNVWLHGNTIEFRERLIKEIGLERVERLEFNRHVQVKWTRGEFENMIKVFSEQIKELKK